MKSFLLTSLLVIIFICSALKVQAQQDPQYTQYMYNTMTVNPAYVGSRAGTTITALGRTQWVGFEGAPDSQTLSYNKSFRYSKMGLGVNLVNDKLGPSHEVYLDANVSYYVLMSEKTKLAFGLKLGGRLLNIDWSLGSINESGDESFQDNIVNRFLPTLGAGAYLYNPKWYVGISVPNFLRKDHYDARLKDIREVAVERAHAFIIAGYVFDLTDNIKFKPAGLFKVVSGAPVSLDLSANFMFNNRFTAGVSWRWDDSISALLGFRISKSLSIGYAYDLTTSNYNVTNTGTHEIMLQYQVFKPGRMKSPRFF